MNNKTRKPGKTSGASVWKLLVLIILSALIITVIFGVGYVVRSIITKPAVNTDNTFYTGTSGTADSDTNQTDTSGEEMKRRENCYNFLLIGKDKAGYNTDVIMLMSYDLNKKSVTILQIPRDTYIYYDGRGRKINSVFSRLYLEASGNGESDPISVALDGFSGILQKNFNIAIDYYAMIDLAGFQKIVDSIGGVTIDIPADMYYTDPEQDLYINLKAGTHTLNGDQAEQFIRFRSGYVQADIGRIDAQKIFMSAFIKQAKSNLSVSQITAIVNSVFRYVKTSLGLSDCIYFAKNAYSDLDMSNITMLSMQGAAYQNGRYYVMYRDVMYYMINEYFNVYNIDIPESYFDVDRVFTDTSNAELNKIYITENKLEDYGLTADDINKDGIDIPRN